MPDWDERIQMVSSFADGISWRVMSWCRRHRKPWFVVTEGSRGRWFVRPVLRLFARFVDRHALMGFFHGQVAAEQFGRLGVRASKRAVCTYPLPDLPAEEIADITGRISESATDIDRLAKDLQQAAKI